VRFEAAAERARSMLESPDAAPLLGEYEIYVHLPEKARKLMGANGAALKRVAAVLGAKVGSIGRAGWGKGGARVDMVGWLGWQAR